MSRTLVPKETRFVCAAAKVKVSTGSKDAFVDIWNRPTVV